jgi:hypothetical protein
MIVGLFGGVRIQSTVAVIGVTGIGHLEVKTEGITEAAPIRVVQADLPAPVRILEENALLCRGQRLSGFLIGRKNPIPPRGSRIVAIAKCIKAEAAFVSGSLHGEGEGGFPAPAGGGVGQ